MNRWREITMVKFRKNQQGYSLFELIVLIIIVGVALPSLISVVGMVTRNYYENEVTMRCISFAESKMEEIISYKEANWDWYKTIDNFAGSETPETGYTVTTSVTPISNWGGAGLDAYEVTATASNSALSDGYSITMRLCKYH